MKPFELWYQIFDENENHQLDLKEKQNTDLVTQNVDYVFNMACNMGGMGFIENNKAECMLSVLINTNLCRSSIENKIKRYFFSSSACVYNANKQKDVFIDGKCILKDSKFQLIDEQKVFEEGLEALNKLFTKTGFDKKIDNGDFS